MSGPGSQQPDLGGDGPCPPRALQNRAIRLLPLAPLGQGNKFSDVFHGALQEAGVRLVKGRLGATLAVRGRRTADAVLLHWPQELYAAESPFRMARFVKYLVQIHLVKARGLRLLWMAHNLWPHERCRLDAPARRWLIRRCDQVWVTFPGAIGAIADAFGSPKSTALVPHPHFIGAYADEVPRKEARRQLGLGDRGVALLCFGAVRRYKQIPLAVREFRSSAGRSDKLLIAGVPSSRPCEQAVRRAAGSDPRVSLHLRFIPNDEVQVFMQACDAVWLPQESFFTSGVALLALGFGRPVVGVETNQLAYVAAPSAFEAWRPGELGRVLERLRKTTVTQRESACVRRARDFSPERCASLAVSALRQVVC